MEIAKNTLFEWTMNFVGREKTPVCITMEVSWVRAWDFGNTTLFRLERYDAKTGELVAFYYKTEEEVKAGLLDADKELKVDSWDFGKKK